MIIQLRFAIEVETGVWSEVEEGDATVPFTSRTGPSADP